MPGNPIKKKLLRHECRICLRKKDGESDPPHGWCTITTAVKGDLRRSHVCGRCSSLISGLH